jgi:dTDP-4-amino-4,6-dideoxygalactose transaminase
MKKPMPGTDAASHADGRFAEFIPFALPDIGEEEIAAVVDALRSGWITTGPRTREFEDRFGEFLGGSLECVAVNSATAGLHLGLEALGVGPGDKVIVPTHTFTATAEVVRYLGADPQFVDIDPATYCMDMDAVESVASGGTRAVIPVHYAGLPCDMPRLSAFARQRGLRVMEDAAHAFPTRSGGRLVGTLDSDVTVFSFYATKTIATGEGGMLVTRDSALARRARIMRLHGIDRDAFDRYTAKKAAWYYEVIAPGYKYNLTDPAAAMGIAQLAKAERFQARRELLAERYVEAFRDLPLAMPPTPRPGDSHSWHLFVVRLAEDSPVGRDEVIERLFAAGVGCSVHYVPLHLQPYWRDRYGLRPEDFPHSQRLYERGFSLPLYTKMTDSQQERVIAAVRSLF